MPQRGPKTYRKRTTKRRYGTKFAKRRKQLKSHIKTKSDYIAKNNFVTYIDRKGHNPFPERYRTMVTARIEGAVQQNSTYLGVTGVSASTPSPYQNIIYGCIALNDINPVFPDSQTLGATGPCGFQTTSNWNVIRPYCEQDSGYITDIKNIFPGDADKFVPLGTGVTGSTPPFNSYRVFSSTVRLELENNLTTADSDTNMTAAIWPVSVNTSVFTASNKVGLYPSIADFLDEKFIKVKNIVQGQKTFLRNGISQHKLLGCNKEAIEDDMSQNYAHVGGSGPAIHSYWMIAIENPQGAFANVMAFNYRIFVDYYIEFFNRADTPVTI